MSSKHQTSYTTAPTTIGGYNIDAVLAYQARNDERQSREALAGFELSLAHSQAKGRRRVRREQSAKHGR